MISQKEIDAQWKSKQCAVERYIEGRGPLVLLVCLCLRIRNLGLNCDKPRGVKGMEDTIEKA